MSLNFSQLVLPVHDVVDDAFMRRFPQVNFRKAWSARELGPLMADTDQPAIELNREKMDRYREQMRKFYYDPAKYGTYLEQLGITYPTLKK